MQLLAAVNIVQKSCDYESNLQMKNKPYQSFAQQFYLEDDGWLARVSRNLRLLKWLLQSVLMWFRARHVRAEFERCREESSPFYVDRFSGPPSES